MALSLQSSQSTLLYEIGRESESLRLLQLSEEVSRIARTLANLSSQDDSPALPLSASASRAETHGGYAVEPVHVSDTPASPVTAREIRDMLRLRRLRDRFFPGDLFADPAWDILLRLIAAPLSGQRGSVFSLCLAPAFPAPPPLHLT